MGNIILDDEKCVHCGACTAVCDDNALHMEKDSWTLGFDEHKCTNCKSCIKACPLRAIN